MFGYWLIWVSVCAMGGFQFVSCVVACVSDYAVGGFWFVPCMVACVSVCGAFVGFDLCRVWVLVCVVGGIGMCSGWWLWLIRQSCGRG